MWRRWMRVCLETRAKRGQAYEKVLEAYCQAFEIPNKAPDLIKELRSLFWFSYRSLKQRSGKLHLWDETQPNPATTAAQSAISVMGAF